MGDGKRKAERIFFFEKKKQKTFNYGVQQTVQKGQFVAALNG
jgi:hypothetical protein